MNALQQNKLQAVTAILGIFAFLFTGAAYSLGENSSAQESQLAVEAQPVSSPENEGSAILALLTEMKKITLDKEIYSNPMFLSLKDFTVELPKEEAYRPNPFAPIGKDASINLESGTTYTTSPFTSTSTETL